jgi:hypothetical protein
MYKNFNLTESERKEIMKMHESRGYKQRLNEYSDEDMSYGEEDFNDGGDGESLPTENGVDPRDTESRYNPIEKRNPEDRIGDYVKFIHDKKKYTGKITSVHGWDGEYDIFIIKYTNDEGITSKVAVSDRYIFETEKSSHLDRETPPHAQDAEDTWFGDTNNDDYIDDDNSSEYDDLRSESIEKIKKQFQRFL